MMKNWTVIVSVPGREPLVLDNLPPAEVPAIVKAFAAEPGVSIVAHAPADADPELRQAVEACGATIVDRY
jgi:hypothetical protein